jgi:hypothetical protein
MFAGQHSLAAHLVIVPACLLALVAPATGVIPGPSAMLCRHAITLPGYPKPANTPISPANSYGNPFGPPNVEVSRYLRKLQSVVGFPFSLVTAIYTPITPPDQGLCHYPGRPTAFGIPTDLPCQQTYAATQQILLAFQLTYQFALIHCPGSGRSPRPRLHD